MNVFSTQFTTVIPKHVQQVNVSPDLSPTRSSAKCPLLSACTVIGRHAISWKLVERTARGPPGLCMPMWWPLLTLEKNFFFGVLNFFFFGVFSPTTSLDTDCWQRHISFVKHCRRTCKNYLAIMRNCVGQC